MGQKPTGNKPPVNKKGTRFVTEYVHHWTKKLMKASDYGYAAWPLGKRK